MLRAVLVTVGFVVLGAGAQQAARAQPGLPPACFLCLCPGQIVTACSSAPIGESQCPSCQTGSASVIGAQDTCDVIKSCSTVPNLTPVRAPALADVTLAGLGMLLVGSGIWLTYKRRPSAP
jgi:hypothetical protein